MYTFGAGTNLSFLSCFPYQGSVCLGAGGGGGFQLNIDPFWKIPLRILFFFWKKVHRRGELKESQKIDAKSGYTLKSGHKDNRINDSREISGSFSDYLVLCEACRA